MRAAILKKKTRVKGVSIPAIQTVAFIGTYLPRKCGIATFTHDLFHAVSTGYPASNCMVLPINDGDHTYDYSPEARFTIREQEVASYEAAADFLNIKNVDVVCIQHEYGIFGGPAGRHLLALLRNLRMPIVTTLHTILNDPDPEQERVMKEVVRLSSRLVVMTHRSEAFLLDRYDAPKDKIDLIPHGIPDMPFIDPNFYKDNFGVEGKTVLLTFGLLSPNKGIEHMIQALPAIIREFPDTVYIVLGATHPHILRDQGDAYRLSLERLAESQGVGDHVIFFNQFVEMEELKEFLGAADIYVLPYLSERQAVSGTLAYSLGAGKAVVSTPFWHAEELLADHIGMLVPFADPAALSKAVIHLLTDEVYRHTMRKNAYRLSRSMIWPEVAQRYVETFSRARLSPEVPTHRKSAFRPLGSRAVEIPALNLQHLFCLTDSTGLIQHATFTVPNCQEGYCTDDNARALILTLLLDEMGDSTPELMIAASRYAALLQYAFDPASGRFRNFLSYDRQWLPEPGSEDSHGRALWALGTCVARARRSPFPSWAGQLLSRALPALLPLGSPRTWAFALLGLHEYMQRFPGDRTVADVQAQLAGRLMALRKSNATETWPWFESSLSYVNAKLPHALFLTAHRMGNPDMQADALASLRWLLSIQLRDGRHFDPVGTVGLHPGEPSIRSDQQPIEAHATITACLDAFRITAEPFWLEQANHAFEWFLGRNHLNLPLYDAVTGGCRDGLHVDRLNENQGAESTLAFLLSLVEMRRVRNEISTYHAPHDPVNASPC